MEMWYALSIENWSYIYQLNTEVFFRTKKFQKVLSDI